MKRHERMILQYLLSSIFMCFIWALPAFAQWSYEQIDAQCNIIALWASSEDDMYAGGADANNIFQGCLYHYDGTGWEKVSFAGLPIVFDIWGSARDDVYLVGLAGRWHYNGATWTRVSTAVGESVWGFSPNDVFMGHTDIRRYQGAGWNAMAFPAGLTSVQIRGLWGLNASEMYAVGTVSTILRYDGNQNGQWEYFRPGLEGTNYDLYDVWASSSEDIFAGGWNSIIHYDGISWTRFDISLPKDDWIHRIWGTGPDDVYAVAYENSSILHYDGVSWSVINSAPSNPSQLSETGMSAANTISELPSALKLKAICGISSDSIYFAGDDGIVVHYTPDITACSADSDCDAGYQCAEGVCEPIPDNPPALGDGPFVAAGSWPLLSASQTNPMYMNQNYSVLWTFSDDFASCSGDCSHTAEYQKVGDSEWTTLSVSSDAAQGYAWVELPVTGLQNATTYAFRFSVTDCASQTTQSDTYYFRVATSDAPPSITGGPWLAAGTWPALPTSASGAAVLSTDTYVLWTFDDDYSSCSGLCTHRARFRRLGEESWTWVVPETDPDDSWYAYTMLPVSGLEAGTYQFQFDVRDCAGQYTFPPHYYYFTVE